MSDTLDAVTADETEAEGTIETDGTAVGDAAEEARPRGRRPRTPQAPRETASVEAPKPEARGVQPHDYEAHLEREHGLKVIAEPGWPTDIRRYRLVHTSPDGRKERSLAAHVGTHPEAVDFFFRYLHPSQRKRTQPRSPRRAA